MKSIMNWFSCSVAVASALSSTAAYAAPASYVPRDNVGVVIHSLAGSDNHNRPFKDLRLQQLSPGWARITLPWMKTNYREGWTDENGTYRNYENLGIEMDPWYYPGGWFPENPYDFDRPGLNETVGKLNSMGTKVFGSFTYVPFFYWNQVYGGQGCDASSCPPFERMVEATVNNFGSNIDVYGMFNEPNDSGHFYGSYDQYINVMIAGCRVVHRLGGECAGPEVTAGYTPELVLKALRAARDSGEPLDVVTVHEYASIADGRSRLQALRDAMAAEGFTQPVWLTETGEAQPIWWMAGYFNSWDKAYESQERVAAEYLSLTNTGLVNKVFLYELEDQGASYGITGNNYCSYGRPAYHAALRQMQGTYRSCQPGTCTDQYGNCSTQACNYAQGNCWVH